MDGTEMSGDVKQNLRNSDEDGDTSVVRIVLQDFFDVGRAKFIETISGKDRFHWENISIFQDNWWCGARFDLGDNFALQLCFDGGNMRWSFWEQVLLPKMNTLAGIILMVDGTKPEFFKWATAEMQSLQEFSPLPFIITIYSLEELGVITLQSVIDALDIPPEIPVVPCVATDKESVKRVLLTLLDEVLNVLAGQFV